MRVDLVRELLKNILSSEDYAKYSAQLEPPKREEPTIFQDLANKFKEHGKVLSQVEHHRYVVRDAPLKVQKHESILKELLDRSQSLQLEINSLQEQADAAKAASDLLLPPMLPPSFPPEDAVGIVFGAATYGEETLLKKASAKNVSVKPETRSSVFAKAGVLSAP